MVIAAMICFAILLVAWVVAPDGQTKTARVTEPEAVPATA
jgi:hypothetical protein